MISEKGYKGWWGKRLLHFFKVKEEAQTASNIKVLSSLTEQ